MKSILLQLLCLILIKLQANDSMALIEGGQLILKESKEIELIREELKVSLSKIEVRYHFRNKSSKDIKTLISFPVPELWAETPYNIEITDYLENKDPQGFKLLIDGKEIKPKIDVVKDLKGENIGANEKYQFTSLKIQYFWESLFPSNKVIEVIHTYKPIIGTGGTLNTKDFSTYCADSSWTKALALAEKNIVAKLKKEHPQKSLKELREMAVNEYAHFHSFSHLAYILKTANNWMGPIGSFKLIVEKPDSSYFISTCFKGLKKVDAKTFEFEAKNYQPDLDLGLVFLRTKYE